MDKITIEISNMDGSAFYDGADGSYQVARILRTWADRFDNDGPLAADTYPVRDDNGARCGVVIVEV